MEMGIDILDTTRFSNMTDRFIKKAFTESEIKYCSNKNKSGEHYAARYAAKEAIIKAIGKFIPYTDIEITNDDLGKPNVNIKYRLIDAKVSLSHIDDYVVAVAWIE